MPCSETPATTKPVPFEAPNQGDLIERTDDYYVYLKPHDADFLHDSFEDIGAWSRAHLALHDLAATRRRTA